VDVRTSARFGYAAALGGLAAVLAGAGAVGLLHLVPPSAAVSPVRRTISEYALLENGWVFNAAVLGLAAGSAGILAALLAHRLLRPAGAAALALWCAGLIGVVVFPKHNWAVGPSLSGDLHRVASLVGFLSLPVAAILIGASARRHPRWRRHALAVVGLGVVSLLCFAPIGYAILTEPITGVRWWRAFPLGAVERALATAEVVTVLAMGWWAARAGRGSLPRGSAPGGSTAVAEAEGLAA
jgi:hypothetical protein